MANEANPVPARSHDSAGPDTKGLPAAAVVGPDEVSTEALRKAESYVEAEEGAANRLVGRAGLLTTGIAVVMSAFHLWAAYDIVPTQELRYIHVAFVLVLSYLLFPVAVRYRNRIRWWDVLPAIASVGIIAYALYGGDDFTDRATVPERWDVILGVVFIVLLLEATRRTTGPIMRSSPSSSSSTRCSGRTCRRPGRIAATTSRGSSGTCSSRSRASSASRSTSRRRSSSCSRSTAPSSTSPAPASSSSISRSRSWAASATAQAGRSCCRRSCSADRRDRASRRR